MPYLSRVSSENNKVIFERVINQVLLDYWGPERCPWTRAIIEGTLLFTKGIYFNIFMCFKCWNWNLFHAWTLKSLESESPAGAIIIVYSEVLSLHHIKLCATTSFLFIYCFFFQLRCKDITCLVTRQGDSRVLQNMTITKGRLARVAVKER